MTDRPRRATHRPRPAVVSEPSHRADSSGSDSHRSGSQRPAPHRSVSHRSGSRGTGSQQPAQSRGVLLRCVDAGLFAAVFVLPFVMGGRQAIGEFTLVLIACWTSLAWLLHNATRRTPYWRITGMEPLLLAGIALCAVQTLKLTPELIETVSPHLSRLLPLWQAADNGAASFTLLSGAWTSVSLVPAATLSSLCSVASVAMLFVIAVQRIDTIADVRLLMRSFAIAATVMAVFGCAQFLLGNGRFFGFYEHPFTHTRDYAKGAFTNPNHFANYLAMAIPILLAWYAIQTSRTDRPQRKPYESLTERLARLSGPIALACLSVVTVGILLSQSRGGLVTACVGAIVTLALLMRQRLLTMTAAGSIGGLAVAALVSLMFFGAHIQSLVEQNFHELVSGDMQQLDRGDARQKIWTAAIKGASDYPLLGTGLSTHREVYWTYFNHPDSGGEYSHAESGYLQLLLETGLVGFGIAAAAVLLIGFWCCRGLWKTTSAETGALLAAIVGVFAVNLVHSITDFIWYVPSCMTVMALLAACAARLCRISTARHPRPRRDATVLSRGVGFAGAALVVLLGAGMAQIKRPALAAEPLWFDYIRIVSSEPPLDDAFDREAFQRHKLATLLAAAKADPHDCRIQLRAAAAVLAAFHEERKADPGRMSLANIREAARASEWDSPQQLQDWLSNPAVIGDRTRLDEAWDRTLHALSLCPLLAEGYIRLGEQAWLRGATRRQENSLLIQALLVRPYDPLVHYSAGREAWLRGNETAALDHWKRAFHGDAKYQQLLIDLLSPAVPAQFFLDNFAPDTKALTRIREAYRESSDQAGFRSVCQLLAARLTEEAAAARHLEAVGLWRKVHEVFAELDDFENARRAAESAVAADPNSYSARLLLGRWLYQTEQYAAACEHLEFCHNRRLQDANLRKLLEVATRRSHDPAPRLAPCVATEAPATFPQRRR